jgi:hypothetical protein
VARVEADAVAYGTTSRPYPLWNLDLVDQRARVSLVSVRVLGCNNAGLYSEIIAGVDWITQNGVHPAVVNMSLGGSRSTALDTAVTNSINAGFTYVLAAGNWNANACDYSPAAVPGAITVGASNSIGERATGWGGTQSGSDYGTCVDLFAPGQEIRSAHNATEGSHPSAPGPSTRNAFGFQEGLGNPDAADRQLMGELVWVQPGDGEPAWCTGGTYQVVRLIQMAMPTWDSDPVAEQERVIGRYKDTGAP